MRSFPPDGLTDGVVSLRRWTLDDVQFIYEYCQDPEIQRWTLVPSPYTEQDAREYIEGKSIADNHISMAVCDGSSGAPAGSVGITVDEKLGVGSIGYVMAPAARGAGYAPAAVRLIAEWACDEFDLGRIEIYADERNDASRRVAEKAGFTFEGILRSYRAIKGERMDAAMYSLLPSELSR